MTENGVEKVERGDFGNLNNPREAGRNAVRDTESPDLSEVYEKEYDVRESALSFGDNIELFGVGKTLEDIPVEEYPDDIDELYESPISEGNSLLRDVNQVLQVYAETQGEEPGEIFPPEEDILTGEDTEKIHKMYDEVVRTAEEAGYLE